MKTFKLMFNYKDEGEPEILGVSPYGSLHRDKRIC